MNKKLTMSFAFFAAVLLLWGTSCDQSIQPPIETEPDTTSHNFVWQIDTFGGGGGSSVLNDVAVINDTLAYAVGEIYLKDSTGKADPNTYNLAKWNGHIWTPLRIQFYSFCGQQHTGSYPANGIWFINESEIWIASNNSQIAIWNGNAQTGTMCLPVSVSKMWGSNRNSVYTVGALGQIGFFNGSSWQKLASGTTTDIQDIWGVIDSRTGEQAIVAVASFLNYGRGLDLLKIDGTSVTKLDTTGLHISESSVWFDNHIYYIAGARLYRKRSITDMGWIQESYQSIFHIDRVRGNTSKDVFLCGSGGFVAHYNGVTWKDYTGVEVPSSYSRYKGLSVRGNTVIAVGWKDDNAVILMGRRMQ